VRVLVIHDRAEVATVIVELIRQVAPQCPIVDVAGNVVAARDLLQGRWYDLAIIDLTLPIMKGLAETRIEHAAALLEEMFAGDDLRTPGDVIGISRDAVAVAGIRSSIGEHVLALVEEDPDGLWRARLEEKVRYVRNTRRGRLLAARTSYDFDVAIITALDKEAQPYRELLELTPCGEFPGGEEFSFQGLDGYAKRGVLVRVGKSGQAPAASVSQAVISQLRPRLVMMTGFCGGVEERVALGDVAVFASAASWDYGKWVEGADEVPLFKARPDPLNMSVRGIAENLRFLIGRPYRFNVETLDLFRRLVGEAAPEPKVVSVAAGSGVSVVTSEQILSRIVDLNENIHAVDMESYGFYYACLNTTVIRPDFVCIKGVADHCNGKKDSKWHAGCSLLSASLALDVVRGYYDFSGEFDV
jgi:nucleoside phosphorylase